MPDSKPTQPNDGPEPAAGETDLLICRIVDGEATGSDRDRFDRVAADDASLWRELALRQQDATLLADRVLEEISGADGIDLHAPSRSAPRLAGRVAAYGGWAAAILLAFAWGSRALLSVGSPESDIATPLVSGEQGRLTPVEHLEAYLRAPFVVGELDPILLEAETMSDGRTAMRFLRRIEEVAFLQPSQEIPAGADGTLTVDPSELRADDEADASSVAD